MKLIKIIVSFMLIVMPFILMAQQAGSEKIDMADAMRSNGKIYVVVAIVTIIMTGLIVYLIALDRKITKLEKRISPKNKS